MGYNGDINGYRTNNIWYDVCVYLKVGELYPKQKKSGISSVFSDTINNIYIYIHMQLTCDCHTFWDESTSQLRRLATICTLKIDGAPTGHAGSVGHVFSEQSPEHKESSVTHLQRLHKVVNHVNAIKCHKPSPSHHHFYGWDSNHQQMVVVHGIGFPTLFPMKTRAQCGRVYVSGKPAKAHKKPCPIITRTTDFGRSKGYNRRNSTFPTLGGLFFMAHHMSLSQRSSSMSAAWDAVHFWPGLDRFHSDPSLQKQPPRISAKKVRAARQH